MELFTVGIALESEIAIRCTLPLCDHKKACVLLRLIRSSGAVNANVLIALNATVLTAHLLP